MRIKFRRADVARIFAATLKAPPGRVPYTGADWDEPERREHGLKLVGDSGVYLMSNADDQKADARGRLDVAYAEGINPDVDADCYDAKRESFGPDDGIDFIDFKSARAWYKGTNGREFMEMDLSPTQFSLIHFE